MMLETDLIINYSSVDEASALAFISYINDFIPSSLEHQNYDITEVSSGTGSYYTTTLCLSVLQNNIEEYLVIVDTIKDGLTFGSEEILAKTFNDIRCVVPEVNLVTVAETTKYLLNKVQEQNLTISAFDTQLALMTDIIALMDKRIAIQEADMKAHEDRLTGHMSFMHTYIDIKNLQKLVYEIAEKVDPDFLEDYSQATVH
jgi:hypothetical protein